MPALVSLYCILLAFLSHVAGIPANLPRFDVEFDSTAPLGVQLDNSLKVTGFRRGVGGALLLAERSGWIEVGDFIVAINEEDVTRLALPAVAQKIAHADLPKVITFAAGDGDVRAGPVHAAFA
jgi:hypothetical protein